MNYILIAPFSNSDIRDWPAEHFAALSGLLLERHPDCRVRVVGTSGQRLRANAIVRRYPAPRMVNECGALSWERLLAEMKGAACLVGNNSGLSHLSGLFGVPTVCVFGGSHQRLEWGPLGESVTMVSRAIGCSPCQLDHNAMSPYGKACLRDISPEIVADAVDTIMRRVAHNPISGRSGNEQEAHI